MPTIDFWYSIGSTYSYLSVMRLPDVARTTGVTFRWRPFNVRHVMVEQNNIPFRDKPVKTAYMWRDIQRRAHRYGLQPTTPAPYPLAGLVLANQVAILGAQEGWGQAYTLATYRRWFQTGQPAGEDPNLSESIAEAGQDPARVLDVACSGRIETALADATVQAMAAGVFGSPSFCVQGEVFWGDDRLQDALDWARAGRSD
jgi:2-hydroxychromene-2-carboxylate isomerase